jgi:hypothetical protein
MIKKMNKCRIYCNSCKSETWHDLVARHEHQRYSNFWGYSQLYVSETHKCCGCEDITFSLIKHPFEFQDKKDKPEENLFPERSINKRDKRFFFNLPKQIHDLYHETVTAHDNELIILSAVGLRALIEAIVANKIEASNYKNNLESKINSLKPNFPDTVINGLHDFRLVANKAAHELNAPDALNIHHALYIVEGLLEYFYGIEDHVRIYQEFRNRGNNPGKKRKTRTVKDTDV